MSTRSWIDFKAVKEAARFEPVLDRYGVHLKGEGAERTGPCPFHEDARPSFSVNVEKRVFHCFGCGAKGNVLDFVARKENVSIRRAAELVADWLGMEKGARERPARKAEPRTREPAPPTAPPEPEEAAEPEANRPLGFALKLDPEHPYLAERGVGRALAEFFGIGFCNRGLLKGRIAIPLHTERGELVGYLGRWPGDDPPDGEERYKLPPGFKKALVVYNLHRVQGAEHLVLVEGCWSVIRLHALGFQAAALLGCALTRAQADRIVASRPKRVTLLMDGDVAGNDAAELSLPRLASRGLFVRMARLPNGAQPDTVSEDELRQALA
jgi:DNA primase